MGYEYTPPTYKLEFEEHPGLQVKARSVNLGEYLEFIDVLDRDGLTKDNVRFIFERFAGFLTEWNLERNGEPLPLSVESLYGLDIKFVREIIDGWRVAMEGVADPLEPSSDDGQQSAVAASIPMESLSASHAS